MNASKYWAGLPEDWGECFSPQFIIMWMENRQRILWVFDWYMRTSVHTYKNLTSSDIFSEIRGDYMPRKQGAKNASGDNVKRGERGVFGDPIQWLNIKLTDNDITELSRQDTTFEDLATIIVGVCADGLSLSIKTVDDGKSYVVTVIRPRVGDNSPAYGVSSFGAELRDALLTAVFKLDTYLDGDFSNAAQYASPVGSQQRFR